LFVGGEEVGAGELVWDTGSRSRKVSDIEPKMC
jgi:hypothetical protein